MTGWCRQRLTQAQAAVFAATLLALGVGAVDLQPEGRSGNKLSKFGEVFLKRSVSNATPTSARAKSHCLALTWNIAHRQESRQLERHLHQLPSPPHQRSAFKLGQGIWSGVQPLGIFQPLEEASPSPFKTLFFFLFFNIMILQGATNV